MWVGVVHVVPPRSSRHQRIELQVAMALLPLAKRRGWYISTDTGVFASDDDYKVPDVVVYSREVSSERGVDGAPEIVIEARSPGDSPTTRFPGTCQEVPRRCSSLTGTRSLSTSTRRLASSSLTQMARSPWSRSGFGSVPAGRPSPLAALSLSCEQGASVLTARDRLT